MKKDEKFVITINRELGSGGRTVGEILAKKLGVAFFDKLLIKELTEKYHLDVNEIERMKGQSHSWWADFKRSMNLGYAMAQSQYRNLGKIVEPDFLTTDSIFESEKEILLGIAAEESCVIAGRSGFYVFRNHPNRLSILIQAPMEQRIARVMERKKIERKEAISIIKKVDKMRENYVKHYAHTSRYDTRNYDLVINMSGKTEEQVADVILQYIG